MGTGAEVLGRARLHIGQAYENVLVPKDNPNWKGPWDCAEFASWLVFQEGGILYGCINDASNPAIADAYTGAWQRDSLSRGMRVSVADAASTEGALLLRFPPQAGAMGHVAVSDGAGGTVEAMDHKHGVAAGAVSGRRWDTGVLVPGIDYTRNGTVTTTAPAVIYFVGAPGLSAAKVTRIQQALASEGIDPGPIDGAYGTQTAAAVAAFQRVHGLLVDGEVGPKTATALGVTL